MRPGITEIYWNTKFGEHERFLWTGFIGIVFAITGYFVPKTPIQGINILLSVYIAINGIFLVHVQRKFRSLGDIYGPKFSRYSVKFFVAGLALLNLGILVGIGIQTFTHFILLFEQSSQRSPNPPPRWVILSVVYFSIFLGFALVLRQMRWFDMMFFRPKRFFIQFIYSRRLQAHSFAQFIAFELGVVYYTILLWIAFSYVTNIILGTTPLY